MTTEKTNSNRSPEWLRWQKFNSVVIWDKSKQLWFKLKYLYISKHIGQQHSLKMIKEHAPVYRIIFIHTISCSIDHRGQAHLNINFNMVTLKLMLRQAWPLWYWLNTNKHKTRYIWIKNWLTKINLHFHICHYKHYEVKMTTKEKSNPKSIKYQNQLS